MIPDAEMDLGVMLAARCRLRQGIITRLPLRICHACDDYGDVVAHIHAHEGARRGTGAQNSWNRH